VTVLPIFKKLKVSGTLCRILDTDPSFQFHYIRSWRGFLNHVALMGIWESWAWRWKVLDLQVRKKKNKEEGFIHEKFLTHQPWGDKNSAGMSTRTQRDQCMRWWTVLVLCWRFMRISRYVCPQFGTVSMWLRGTDSQASKTLSYFTYQPLSISHFTLGKPKPIRPNRPRLPQLSNIFFF
jgi:hypothetical protein